MEGQTFGFNTWTCRGSVFYQLKLSKTFTFLPHFSPVSDESDETGKIVDSVPSAHYRKLIVLTIVFTYGNKVMKYLMINTSTFSKPAILHFEQNHLYNPLYSN